MRQKRAKAYRKLMAVYSHAFGFRQPYQILIDADFCQVLHDCKFDVAKQLHTVLQGDVKPSKLPPSFLQPPSLSPSIQVITQCCIHWLYINSNQSVVDLAKTFERRKCNHREPVLTDECLSTVVGQTNKHRYVIATQSSPLRTALRNIAGIPIVHMNRSVMVLEPPSDATLKQKQKASLFALMDS